MKRTPFNQWLGDQMRQRGLSNYDLAGALGVRYSTISGWRSQGRDPLPETVRQLGDYFGVPVEDVIALTKWAGRE